MYRKGYISPANGFPNMPEEIKVGDVMVCGWGYSMILYTFARVDKISPKSMLVTFMKSDVVGDEGYGQPLVAASKTEEKTYDGNPIRVRLFRTKYGRWFTRCSMATGHADGGSRHTFEKWDGQPLKEDHNF